MQDQATDFSIKRNVVRATGGFGLFFGALLILCAAIARADSGTWALTHATVIDPGGGARPDETIVISGERIASTGQSPPPQGARIVDARGKFLIPGLCDMHVHLTGVTADPKWSKATLLPLLLANGVTTVRDMGGDLAALQSWRQEIARGNLLAPRLYFAGPMLDGGKSHPPDLLGVTSPNEGRAAVRELKARGADFIKVLSRLDRASYFAIADEAKKEGLTFVGHVPNELTAAEAAEAGQKSIEHIFYSNLAYDCSSRGAELRQAAATARARNDQVGVAAARDAANVSYSSEKAAVLCQTLVRHKTWLVPTLVALRAIARERETARSGAPELAWMPATLRQAWSPNEIEKEISPEVAQWYLAQFENDLKLARILREGGVQMLTGSDSLDPFNFPGSSLHEELKLFTEIGCTPGQALQAATSKPAEFLNATGEGGWGTIRPGQSADLVLLDANPLVDIGNSRKIAAVVVRGKFLERAALDRMLAEARKSVAE